MSNMLGGRGHTPLKMDFDGMADKAEQQVGGVADEADQRVGGVADETE